VFKAIESERTRDRLNKLTRRSVDSLPATNLGVIAEDLIYLVVLRDGRGICTVCFLSLERRAQISPTPYSFTSQIFQVRIAFPSQVISCLTAHIEHLGRVREKVLLLDENINRSSGKDFSPTFFSRVYRKPRLDSPRHPRFGCRLLLPLRCSDRQGGRRDREVSLFRP
jgi:hypothetical protein